MITLDFCTELFMLSPLLCSLLLAVPLSLHIVTFVMFSFTVVYVIFSSRYMLKLLKMEFSNGLSYFTS